MYYVSLALRNAISFKACMGIRLYDIGKWKGNARSERLRHIQIHWSISNGSINQFDPEQSGSGDSVYCGHRSPGMDYMGSPAFADPVDLEEYGRVLLYLSLEYDHLRTEVMHFAVMYNVSQKHNLRRDVGIFLKPYEQLHKAALFTTRSELIDDIQDSFLFHWLHLTPHLYPG